MNSLEIKISLSGDELKALQILASTPDDVIKLRKTARTIFKMTLRNMKTAVESCLNGEIGGIELEPEKESAVEEAKKL